MSGRWKVESADSSDRKLGSYKHSAAEPETGNTELIEAGLSLRPRLAGLWVQL